jgi:hypothetical protein
MPAATARRATADPMLPLPMIASVDMRSSFSLLEVMRALSVVRAERGAD